MSRPLYFSKNERTKQQRRDVVAFAVGVSLSQNRAPSPLMIALQKQYIAGKIDLEQLGARIDAEYHHVPGLDVAPAHVYDPYIELNLDDCPTSLS